MYSDLSGDFTRDYVSAEDADVPGYTVFTRRDGTIRHFWSGEMSGAMADPGQDPRGAPDPDPSVSSCWTPRPRAGERTGTPNSLIHPGARGMARPGFSWFSKGGPGQPMFIGRMAERAAFD